MTASAGDSSPESYIHDHQQYIRASIQRELRFQTNTLRRTSSDAEPPEFNGLVDLLNRAVAWQVVSGNNDFIDFVQAVTGTIIRQGVGENFEESSGLLSAMENAANALSRLGKPTTDLHIVRARFASTIVHGGADRLKAIEAAIESAQSTDDYLRAQIELAKFNIDTSSYGEAQRIAHECEKMVTSSAPEDATVLAEIPVVRALAAFYTEGRAAAAPFLQQILNLAETFPTVSGVQRAAGEAHHIYGRIHAMDGEHIEAIREYIEAQRLAEGSGIQTRKSLAYFHIRVADALVDANSLEDTRYHLNEANRILRSAQVSSDAEAQFDIVSARLQLKQGNRRQAEKILRDAAENLRRDRHVRGTLVAMVQLVRVQVAGYHFIRAFGTGMRAVLVWWSTESNSAAANQSRGTRRQAVRAAAASIRQLIASRPRGASSSNYGLGRIRQVFTPTNRASQDPIRCPCGHHSVQIESP